MLNAIKVKLNASVCIFGEGGCMCNSLKKVSPFMNEDVFIGNKINERVVDYIEPNILREVILMNAYNTILLKIAVFFCVRKSIAAVPSFKRPEVSMGIQVYAID